MKLEVHLSNQFQFPNKQLKLYIKKLKPETVFRMFVRPNKVMSEGDSNCLYTAIFGIFDILKGGPKRTPLHIRLNKLIKEEL